MENFRIQDDLYMHVNSEALENLVIPDDKPTAGGFSELSDAVEKIMMDEFETMAASKSYPNDYLKRACELYNLAKDADRKEKMKRLIAYYSASGGAKFAAEQFVSLLDADMLRVDTVMKFPKGEVGKKFVGNFMSVFNIKPILKKQSL